MAPQLIPSNADDESQPLTDESVIFSASNHSSPTRRPSDSTASTTSLVLEQINEHLPQKKPERFHDDEEAPKDEFEELDIEDGPLYTHGRPLDARYRKWLWIMGAVCAVGWALAFVLFVAKGSYKHRSSLAHDPDATASVGSGKRITLEQVQGGQWYPRQHGLSWIATPDGRDGMLLEEGGSKTGDFLVVEDVRGWEEGTETASHITLMKRAGFEYKDETISPSNVWPSADFRTVLIQSDKAQTWRHSSTGRFWLFDVESQTGQPLDPAHPNDKIQLGTWSPKSDAVVFTRDNNMFLRRLSSDRVTQITRDGGEEMFNGVPDWVYEEEVFSGDSTTWYSPDGKYVAFLATNESKVPEFPLQYYMSRPTGTKPLPGQENYPDERRIKYPRAGSPNPTVHLRFYDIEKENVFDVSIDGDLPDDDRLITEVIWAGETSQALIRQTNRESDLLKMALVDAANRQGRIVREKDVQKLDGGWFEVSETTTFVPADASNGRPDDGYIDTVIHEGYDHLAYFSPLDSAEPKVMLTSGAWEVVEAPSRVDLKNNLVYFTATKESSIQRHSYKVSLDGTSLEAVTDTSQEGYYSVSYSKLGGFALVTYKGPKIPWQKVISTPSNPTSFSHTVEENGALSKMASAHELPRKMYSTINVDGVDLNVVERLPPHFDYTRRYPVLFYLYGGPGSQTVDKQFSVDFQSYVASALGYIVVSVDNRGTGYIGRAARTIVRGNIGYYEAYDQIQTAKHFAARDYVDETRMAIWGWSYGGYLTLKTIEQDAGQTFSYGMAVAPVTDWAFYDSIYTERWMHTPQNNPGGYANASVSNTTALAQNTRFLVMHGTADDNVHFQNSLTLLDKLDVAGVENYDVHVFPDSNHNIGFHGANRIVYDKLSWWLVNAFNGEWARIRKPVPIRKGQQVGTVGKREDAGMMGEEVEVMSE